MSEKFGLSLKRSIRSLLHIRLVRLLALEAGALLISFLLIGIVGVIVVSIFGHVYGIPDPATGEDDLGAGLIMATAAFASLLISLPGSVLVHIYIFRKFFFRDEKHE